MHHEKDVIFFATAPAGPAAARSALRRPRRHLHDAPPRPARLPRFGPRMRRGRRIRRGDVRAAILLLVEEEPRNGYQIMQELEIAQRRRLAPEPRLGLPRAPTARRRGPAPERGARRRQRLRADRRRQAPTSRRTASGSARRGSRPARACPRACASSAGCSAQVGDRGHSRSCTPAPRRRSPRRRSSSPRRGARSTACSPTTSTPPASE